MFSTQQLVFWWPSPQTSRQRGRGRKCAYLWQPLFWEKVHLRASSKIGPLSADNGNVNVNVNLYSASSQKAPLMRSMCRVLIKKTRLQCTTKTVNLHVRLTQIVLEQVLCRWSSDSEGATAVHIELKRVRLAERRCCRSAT